MLQYPPYVSQNFTNKSDTEKNDPFALEFDSQEIQDVFTVDVGSWAVTLSLYDNQISDLESINVLLNQ